jgi:hypothetical protein
MVTGETVNNRLSEAVLSKTRQKEHGRQINQNAQRPAALMCFLCSRKKRLMLMGPSEPGEVRQKIMGQMAAEVLHIFL